MPEEQSGKLLPRDRQAAAGAGGTKGSEVTGEGQQGVSVRGTGVAADSLCPLFSLQEELTHLGQGTLGALGFKNMKRVLM